MMTAVAAFSPFTLPSALRIGRVPSMEADDTCSDVCHRCYTEAILTKFRNQTLASGLFLLVVLLKRRKFVQYSPFLKFIGFLNTQPPIIKIHGCLLSWLLQLLNLKYVSSFGYIISMLLLQILCVFPSSTAVKNIDGFPKIMWVNICIHANRNPEDVVHQLVRNMSRK